MFFDLPVFLGIRSFFLLFFLFLFVLSSPVMSFDLSLNDHPHAFISSEKLFAHVFSDPLNPEEWGIPLSALFPYLDNVEHLEIQWEEDRFFWDNLLLRPEIWENARVLYKNEAWEIGINGGIYRRPHRINVRAEMREIPPFLIWSNRENPSIPIRDSLDAALALRGIRPEWRYVKQISLLLKARPQGELPHLVLLSDLDVLDLEDHLLLAEPYAQEETRWYARLPHLQTSPLAIDARSPDAILPYLLSLNPELFDDKGELPSVLGSLLEDWALARDAGKLLLTESPLTALRQGTAHSAMRIPYAGDSFADEEMGGEISLMGVDPELHPLLRRRYIAVPSALSSQDGALASRAFSDILRYLGGGEESEGIALPNDSRVPLFYEAYRGFGRLVLSHQMSGKKALELMNRHVKKIP